MAHPIRVAVVVALAIAVFALLSHLGGMYLFHEHLGSGAVFSLWWYVLWALDLPARLVFAIAGIGLRFEYFDMDGVPLVLDLAVYTVVIALFWFGTAFLVLWFIGRVRARQRGT